MEYWKRCFVLTRRNRIRNEDIRRRLIRYKAVSYTHLDVYKRQERERERERERESYTTPNLTS